jgi:hypothetical protein
MLRGKGEKKKVIGGIINSGHLNFKEKNRTRLTRTMNNIDITQVHKVESSMVWIIGFVFISPKMFYKSVGVH